MPAKTNPTCADCKKTESLLWRSVDNGQICQICFETRETAKTKENTEDSKSNENADDKLKKSKEREVKEDTKDKKDQATSPAMTEDKSARLRKSTRATRFKAKVTTNVIASNANGSVEKPANTGNSKVQTKGRNRRSLFKKVPLKTPQAQATTHSVESCFHKGSYLQVGDIVSLVDGEDNVYYAQIRGLLIDNYCEKSAFLTWLIPTQESPDPREGFDAATYLIGPDEELSRKLNYLEFVMHAPSNYYLDRTTPFPLPDTMDTEKRQGGYIWTTLPEYQRRKTIDVA